jgi:hypothetical protein
MQRNFLKPVARHNSVTPAKAGVYASLRNRSKTFEDQASSNSHFAASEWTPAFAGVTKGAERVTDRERKPLRAACRAMFFLRFRR